MYKELIKTKRYNRSIIKFQTINQNQSILSKIKKSTQQKYKANYLINYFKIENRDRRNFLTRTPMGEIFSVKME